MINRNIAKLSSKRYIILAIVLLVLAGGLFVLPEYQKNESITSSELLANVTNLERYMNADDLADKLINDDPSIVLVDLRSEKEFEDYTLPNAVNVPFTSLLDEKFEGYFDQDQYEVLLFSNEDYKANQAWLLLTRLGYKSLHVLEGGINGWHSTILSPPKPTENMSKEAFILHNKRIAAAHHFGVGYIPVKKVMAKPKKKVIKKKVVVPIKKKKKRMPEGGC